MHEQINCIIKKTFIFYFISGTVSVHAMEDNLNIPKTLVEQSYNALSHHFSYKELVALGAKRNFSVEKFFDQHDVFNQKQIEFQNKAAAELIGKIRPAEFSCNKIKAVTFRSDSKELAISHVKQVMFLDIDSNNCTLIPTNNGINSTDNSIMYSPDNTQLLLNYGGELVMLDLIKKQTTNLKPGCHDVYSTDYLDNEHLIFSSNINKIEILNLKTDIKELFYDNHHIVDFNYNKKHNKLVAETHANLQSTIKLWNGIDSQPIDIISPDYPISYLNFNADATMLITCGSKGYGYHDPECADSVIRLWDLKEERCIHCFDTHKYIPALTYSPNNEFIAYTPYQDTKIILMHRQQPEPIGNLSSSMSIRRKCLHYSPDGLLLAAGSNNKIKIYDMRKIPEILLEVKTMTYKDLDQKLNQNID